MSDIPQTNAVTVSPAKPSVDQMLSLLMASFGKKPKAPAGKRNPSNSKKIDLAPLPVHLAWNEKKTGYRNWKATARVIQLEEQTCRCCGSTSHVVKDELYELENTTAHSVWLRHEGFGIEDSGNLPIRYVDLEPRPVSACAQCRHTQRAGLDHILGKLFDTDPRQLSFPF